jgi:phenylalanyl-tRNA synthetase beta subunit
MRIESRTYEYSVKIFEVGEVVHTTSNRCPLEHPAEYTVIKFSDSFGYGDSSTVDVADSTGDIHYGISTEYLSA